MTYKGVMDIFKYVINKNLCDNNILNDIEDIVKPAIENLENVNNW